MLDCAGLVAVVTVVLAFVTASEFDAALFDRGGFLRTGLASAVVILAATRQGIVATLLSGPLLSGAGRRSYGLYLYHWPVFVLCRDVAVPEWLRITLCLALTYTITEVSYCWMEIPVRRGGLRTAARVLRLPRPAATGAVAAATAAVVTVVVASTGVPTGLDGDPVTDGPTALAAPAAVSVAASGPDAKVGRQFAASPAIVEAWTRAHGGPVVVALGANGTVSRRDLDAVLAAAGSRRVVLVGVAVARRWRDGNNAVLRDAAARAPQVAFVDWAALVAANPGTLGPDGVHPGPRGRALLARAVAAAIGR